MEDTAGQIKHAEVGMGNQRPGRGAFDSLGFQWILIVFPLTKISGSTPFLPL